MSGVQIWRTYTCAGGGRNKHTPHPHQYPPLRIRHRKAQACGLATFRICWQCCHLFVITKSHANLENRWTMEVCTQPILAHARWQSTHKPHNIYGFSRSYCTQ